MQYAMRISNWKLLAGYGSHSDRGHGPKGGGDVVPWLRTVRLGRVELYLLSHDPAERVDLSAARPDVVALMLPRLQRLLHEVATDGPDTPGWKQRGAPCPRRIRSLNVTEVCCHSRSRLADSDDEAGHGAGGEVGKAEQAAAFPQHQGTSTSADGHLKVAFAVDAAVPQTAVIKQHMDEGSVPGAELYL